MPISSVQSFTDADEYSSSMRDFRYELTVTGGGDFTAEHVRVELHNMLLQGYYSNLPWVAHTETMKGRAALRFARSRDQAFCELVRRCRRPISSG